MRGTSMAISISSVLIWAIQVPAQLPQVADGRLGVDAVYLNGGGRLYGFVLQRAADGHVTVAVEREWLQRTDPERFRECQQRELEQAAAAQLELTDRIDQWLRERPDDGQLGRYLRLQLERIKELPAEPEATRFFSVDLSAAEVRQVVLQPANRRQLAGLAYQHGLADVVTTPAARLERRLTEQAVDVNQEVVDLSAELPRLQRQSPRQWAARRALVEFQHREPLEYQGTGQTFLRRGETADPLGLLGQLLGGGDLISQVGAELGLPEFAPARATDAWWKKLTRQAEQDGFHGMLVLQLEQDPWRGTVEVAAHFFAREKPGSWFSVVVFRAKANASEQPAERLERIREDPQIQSVVSAFDSLGLASSEQLERALRHGAATQQALHDAQAQFYAFLDQQTQALSGPPVPVSD